MKAIAAILLLALPSCAAPSFDVASIRVNPNPDRWGVGPIQNTADSLTARNVSLWMCVRWAWNLQNSQVSAPEWMQTAPFFDIAAKTSGPQSQDQMRLMLQSLLTERFHLTAHTEKKEMPVIAIVAGKGGAKIHESTGKYDPDLGREAPFQFLGYDSTIHIQAKSEPGPRMRFTFTNVSMKLFAAVLELAADRSPYDKLAVADLTGIDGRFDFGVLLDLPSHEGGDDDEFYRWRKALPAQLGLTLESQKATIDVLVVDHADKEPTEN